MLEMLCLNQFTLATMLQIFWLLLNTVYFNLAPSKSVVLKSTAHRAANTAVSIQIPGLYTSYKLIPM